MECKCKICRHNLGELVNNLYQSGSPNSEILQELANKNCETNASALTRHLKKVGIFRDKNLEVGESRENRGTTQSNYQIANRVNPGEYDLNSINFDRYNFDETSPMETIEYLQRVHLSLYLKQLEIVAREQDDYYKGERELPPGQSITRLNQLYEMLNNLTGISIYANQQAAIQKVQMMGLVIKSYNPLLTNFENEEIQ